MAACAAQSGLLQETQAGQCSAELSKGHPRIWTGNRQKAIWALGAWDHGTLPITDGGAVSWPHGAPLYLIPAENECPLVQVPCVP